MGTAQNQLETASLMKHLLPWEPGTFQGAAKVLSTFWVVDLFPFFARARLGPFQSLSLGPWRYGKIIVEPYKNKPQTSFKVNFHPAFQGCL